ncbi:MAG: peptidylprolyl isomerase [Myxococcota bacterium]|nr:peptidylprolyl isomerase [Myxococcota bacterium]
MKTKILTVLLCVGALACQNSGGDSAKKQGGDKGVKSGPESQSSALVAKVNGEGITKAAYDKEVEQNLSRYKGIHAELPEGIDDRIKESVLRRMIDAKVIEFKAKALGLNIGDADVEAKFQEHKKRFRTEESFKSYLERSKNTVENMKLDLKRNLVRDAVIEKMTGKIEVSAEETAKYYEENQARFAQKEQIKASRILVRMAKNASKAEQKTARAAAQKAYKEIKGGKPFAEVAKVASQAPEAARGGDLGWLRRGRMAPAFDNAAFGLKEGALSKVVKTNRGYEIIKVWSKKEARQKPLDEVKESIETSILARRRNEKRREVMLELRKGAKVEQLIKFARPQAPRPGAVSAKGAPVKPGMPKPKMPMPNMEKVKQLQKKADPHAGHDHGPHGGDKHGSHDGHNH